MEAKDQRSNLDLRQLRDVIADPRHLRVHLSSSGDQRLQLWGNSSMLNLAAFPFTYFNKNRALDSVESFLLIKRTLFYVEVTSKQL